MAKKQERTKPDFFSTMLAATEKEENRTSTYGFMNHFDSYWGIPIPWIPLQWLVGGINIFPYGSLSEFAGTPGSMKSSLMVAIMREVVTDPINGLAVFIDVEAKTGPTFLTALLWNDQEIQKRFHYVGPFRDTQDWQRELTAILDKLKEIDPDSHYPVLFGIDSLLGRLSGEEQDKFDKEGVGASRGYPVTAKSIGDFVRAVPGSLKRGDNPCYPVAMIGINQLMTKIDSATYIPGKYTAGGVRKDFQAASRIWMQRINRDDIGDKTLNAKLPKKLREKGIEIFGGGNVRRIKLKSEKSSWGPDERDIEVDMYFGHARDGLQYTWFDWDTSMLNLLDSKKKLVPLEGPTVEVVMASDKKSFNVAVNDKDVFDVYQPTTVVADFINETPEVLATVNSCLHIQKCKAHVNNVGYKELFGL